MSQYEWKKWPIMIIKKDDPHFPPQLRKVPQCPISLYYRGEWNMKLFDKTISVVGSRRMTKYGQIVIQKLMPDLVAEGATVVSGFMYGVDSEAHQNCLTMGGKTIAVLAGGLNYLVPSENDELYTNILKNGGLVISEYEADFKATLWSFPQRNRIVSGLATLGVLVVEASIDSGSLVTAQLATKQGKPLFAVPGPISSSTSIGCNLIIKSGKARMVTETNDILSCKKQSDVQLNYLDDLNKDEAEIVLLLGDEPLTIDEICRKIKKNIAQTSSILSILGIRGMVEENNGCFYKKK